MCGCPGGSTGRLLGIKTLGFIPKRTLIRIPEQEEKKTQKEQHKYSSPPICKTGTWSCTGEQSTLAVSHCPLMVVVGHRVPTPAVGGIVGTSCELLARAPGVLIASAHRTCLVHRCPGLSRNA